MTAYLRPDERVREKEREKIESTGSALKSGVMALGSVALGTGSAALASRLLPFLNEYIPSHLAVQGISKLSPQLGKFLQQGQKMGLDVKEGLEKLKENITSSKEGGANIIKQYSPELYQFLDQEIRNGRSPLQAAAIAQHDSRFSNVIKKMSKDHKSPWSSIIEMAFGKGDVALPSGSMQSTPQQQMEQGGVDPQLAQIIQQGQALMQRIRGNR